MHITENQLRKMIREEILNEFLGFGKKGSSPKDVLKSAAEAYASVYKKSKDAPQHWDEPKNSRLSHNRPWSVENQSGDSFSCDNKGTTKSISFEAKDFYVEQGNTGKRQAQSKEFFNKDDKSESDFAKAVAEEMNKNHGLK